MNDMISAFDIVKALDKLVLEYHNQNQKLLDWQDFICYLDEVGSLEKRHLNKLFHDKLIDYSTWKCYCDKLDEKKKRC